MKTYWLETVDSTNNYLKSIDDDGAVVIAKKQEKGRGQGDNVFVSDEGGLYMSIKLPRAVFAVIEGCDCKNKYDLFLYGAAIVVKDVLEGLGLECVIKPPNDIMVRCTYAIMDKCIDAHNSSLEKENGVESTKISRNNVQCDIDLKDILYQKGYKKICGILTECVFLGDKLDDIIIGIGININNTICGDLSLIAESVKGILGKTTSIPMLAGLITENLLKILLKPNIILDIYNKYRYN